MSEAELIFRSAVYVLVALMVIAGSIWYGWDLREHLAVKIEYFGISQKRWREYDQLLKKGELPHRPAAVHDFRESRDSQR